MPRGRCALNAARNLILEALERGEISAREAGRLLDALAGAGGKARLGVRIRVVETATGWVKTDVLVPSGLLETAAHLGLRLDALWGLGDNIEAAAVVAALHSGAEGLLAQVENEGSGLRLDVIAELAQ